MKKGYSTQHVADLLGLSQNQVRAYARSGCLAPHRGGRRGYRFSFQDLVLLRTAKNLTGANLSHRRVLRALSRLRRQVAAGRPLSEVQIEAAGSAIVVRDAGRTWDPESGQFQLDFTALNPMPRVAPRARRGAAAARGADGELTAEDWYELGFELEGSAPAEASDAYRRALELNPVLH